MEEAEVLSSQTRLTLDLPPSCLEFCPSHTEYFVVGTYNLQKEDAPVEQGANTQSEAETTETKKPQSRNGSLLVFKIGSGSDDGLTKIQTVSQPSALLDLRFQPSSSDSSDILATVSSTGSLAIFKLDPTANAESPLQHLATSRCEDLGEDVLFLQCAWHPTRSHVIGVTTSTSLARLLFLDESWQIKDSVDLDIENSLEAWSIALSPLSPNPDGEGEAISIYSGGDDSILRYTSRSWNEEDEIADSVYAPITVRNKHEAGVTAILPLPLVREDGGRVVLTGSYDDTLRVFLIEDLNRSYGAQKVRQVGDINLGGGVWRLNLIHAREEGQAVTVRVLASCMHAGARIVDVYTSDGESWDFKVLARFEEHKSMNYAGDFMRLQDGLRVVSTSFYDKLLCVWDYKGN